MKHTIGITLGLAGLIVASGLARVEADPVVDTGPASYVKPSDRPQESADRQEGAGGPERVVRLADSRPRDDRPQGNGTEPAMPLPRYLMGVFR